MISISVIGCGYWGPNYVRTFNGLRSARVSQVCDIDAKRLRDIQTIYPSIETTTRYQDVVENPKVDAVCLSTPAYTHHEIGMKALRHHKHVLIEKPLALSSRDASELVELAKKEERVLMVGHVYLYHPAVQKIKSYFEQGEFDDLYYLHSARTGLGPVRRDTNALWDLAPHDLSIYLHLLEDMPRSVSASGGCHLQKGIEDIVFLTLEFPKNVMGFVYSSWLDPYKSRRLTVVAKRKMLLFEDAAPAEKIKIFNQENDEREPRTYGEFLLQERSGDIHIPRLDAVEPLKNECSHFVKCVEQGADPISDGVGGLRVVKILEAATDSLRNNGSRVFIGQTS